MKNRIPSYASAKTLAAACETTQSTIWRWAKSGRIPRPVKLGPCTTRWDVEQVREALAKAAAAEGAE